MNLSDISAAMRTLQREGKLHPRLRARLRLMIGLATVMAAVALYDIVFRDLPVPYAFGLFILGLPLGAHVFARMTRIEWDEKREILRAARMDVIGFATLVMYVLFEIALKTFLREEFSGPVVATGLILSGVCGTMYGRALGTMAGIHEAAGEGKPPEAPGP